MFTGSQAPDVDDGAPSPVGGSVALAVAACTVVGFGLVLSPAVEGFSSRGDHSATFWNDLVVGVLLLSVSAVGVLRRLSLFPWLTAAIGAWLLVAPLLLEDGDAPGRSAATRIDLLGGVVVLAASVVMIASLRAGGTRAPRR